MYDVIVIGCGLSGMVTARKLADKGYQVCIIERRNHIGGNIFDKLDEDDFLVQMYGPHCFFTNDKRIKSFVENYVDTVDCFVKCKTVINNLKIPMPFNFKSIDIIYKPNIAKDLKSALLSEFKGKSIVAVTDLLNSKNELIRNYGLFMYENEYKLYSAKQWGLDISCISPDVFKRVPVYLSYCDTYQSHQYQFLPQKGFTHFAKQLIQSKNINVILKKDAIKNDLLKIKDNILLYDDNGIYKNIPIVFTGALDELFNYKYGALPYRSLEFIWKFLDIDEYQETAITAYPQADKITRVTEYKKLPPQNIAGKTKISIEIPVPYDNKQPIGTEPYYPIKNDFNDAIYQKYMAEAQKISNLFLCGRLAEYKYYNMDEVIIRAWETAERVLEKIK